MNDLLKIGQEFVEDKKKLSRLHWDLRVARIYNKQCCDMDEKIAAINKEIETIINKYGGEESHLALMA